MLFRFWEISTKRYDRNIKVFQQEEKPDESPKYDVTCTVSISNTVSFIYLKHTKGLKFIKIFNLFIIYFMYFMRLTESQILRESGEFFIVLLKKY